MRTLLTLACVLLCACDGPGLSKKQRQQTTDIADESADTIVAEHATIEDLKSRVSQLESKLGE